MKTVIVYHRVDWDGYTSAAVALRAFPKADLLGWTYGDQLPDTSDYDSVILVDLTIYTTTDKGVKDYSWMYENASKLVWIDHHVSTILDVDRADIPGLRVYNNELTLEQLFLLGHISSQMRSFQLILDLLPHTTSSVRMVCMEHGTMRGTT